MPLPPSDNTTITGKFSSEADIQDFLASDDEKDTRDNTDKNTKDTTDKDEDSKDNKDIELKDDEDDDKLDLDEKDEKDEKDSKKDDKKGRKSKSENKDEEDDLDDEDDEDDEKEEDDEDEIEIDTPPRKAEINKFAPGIFKRFPWLEKVIYRDRQILEQFGRFDDLKLHYQKAQVLDKFNEDLISGNTERLLTGLKTQHPKAFDKVVNNYLKTLYTVDKDAYHEVVANVSRSIIGEVQRFADRKKDDGLKEVAKFLSQFLLDSDEVDTKLRFRAVEEEKDDKNKELEDKEREFLVKRFEVVRDDLGKRVDRILTNTIAEHIDPDGELSDYLKKNATRDCLSRLHRLISKDPEFQSHLDNLWRYAEKNEFSDESAQRIKKFYLGRAKRLLPNAMKKTLAEVRKNSNTSSRREDNSDRSDRTSRERRELNPGRPHQNSGKNLKMNPGESVYDFLSRD